MKKLINLLIIICFIPQIAFAANGRVYPIEQNEVAPYEGLLLDKVALAKIKAKEKLREKKCFIEKERSIKLLEAESETRIDNMKISIEELENQKKELNNLLTLRNKKIKDLEVKNILYLFGGIATGLAAGGIYIVIRDRF